jgi:hypothetical protein
MITKEQAILICKSTHLSDVQQLEVIRKYIFDKKGVDVGEINRPTTGYNLQLMTIAFDSACEFYLK